MKINLLYKNIAILGFGKEGESTLRFLQKNGILDGSITVLDANPDLKKIKGFEGNIIAGSSYLDTLDQYDYIFKSPGLSPYKLNLERYQDKIITQTKLFYEYYNGPIISITQTKGKSTTASLVFELLTHAGFSVKLVGNIGKPVLDEIDLQSDEYDFVIYELSSYMLDDLDNHKSFITIFGNIYKDHIDWHGSFEKYFEAKKHVLQNAQNLLIGQELYPKLKKDLLNRNYFTFGGEGAYYSHLKNEFFINGELFVKNLETQLFGDHNLDNISAIVGLSDLINLPIENIIETVKNFRGLPHRLENIGTYKDITFIDDAISTTPESTMAAIKTFEDDVDTIFLGGTDRGYDFGSLITLIEQSNISNIVLFPDTGNIIQKLFKKKFNILETHSMEEAVKFAFQNTKKNKICLLSTASPSYSLWKNFEEKGSEFQKYVKRHS